MTRKSSSICDDMIMYFGEWFEMHLRADFGDV